MEYTEILKALQEQINTYFVGKEEVVDDVLTCLLAGGHILIEDVPGVGKTTLARTLARSIDASFARIQFTPDTLPGDVVGMSVYDMKSGDFSYKEGAIMHQLILADEINRTPPKTQASLLEAMAEGQVSVDGKTYALPRPFLVIATQNPVEFLGTYPLPEAQIDRFMMRLSIGYPDAEEEIRMAQNHMQKKTAETAAPVCSAEDILKLREAVENVHVSEALLTYIREIVAATRMEKRFVLGASPRAMLNLIAASRARACLCGRDFVKPDDVKAVALQVLHHRLVLTAEGRIGGEDPDSILKGLILKVKVPME
ncbi:MAG: MoxR family ATPase [Lachnospiraceae bacterium]|nr:MoxR family ATPase [Lachnospiraceae bacterium]